MNHLVVATKNNNKLNEIKYIFSDIEIPIMSLKDLGCKIPDIIEDGDTFKKNAIKKALLISSQSNNITLADDSGICIDFLNGGPGVFSARFAGSDKNDRNNRLKVIKLMKNVSQVKRGAHFVCSIAIAHYNKLIGLVECICEGLISDIEIGNNGFGYDSIFYYPKENKTFGELKESEKNSVSHRFKALTKAKIILKDYL